MQPSPAATCNPLKHKKRWVRLRAGDSATVYSNHRRAGCTFFAVARDDNSWDLIVGWGVCQKSFSTGMWVELPEKLGYIKYCGQEEKRRRLKLQFALPEEGDERIISARHALSDQEKAILGKKRQ